MKSTPATANDPSGLQPYGIYPTGAGYISIGAIGGPFLRLKQVVPGLDQEQLQQRRDRPRRGDQATPGVDWLADRRRGRGLNRYLTLNNIPCSKVMAAPYIARNPHHRARGMLLELD